MRNSTLFEGKVKLFSLNPSWDLGMIALTWVLVVGALYAATTIATPEQGILYFVLYAVVGALLFGIGLPLYWMVVVRKRDLADLGLTLRHWKLSIALQLVIAGIQFTFTLAKSPIPPWEQVVPLVALALCIGFFEAVFWRGWVLLRLEEAFGLVPAILVGSALYAAYHIGYGMNFEEMAFLFYIGIMFAIVFRITKSVLILWPLFQPMGQLITLFKDQLSLPLIATVGFFEVLVVMIAAVIGVGYCLKRKKAVPTLDTTK